MEAGLQNGEGDAQTIWLNIKEEAASETGNTHPPHYCAARGLRDGEMRTYKASGTQHLQEMHSQEAEASVCCLLFPIYPTHPCI